MIRPSCFPGSEGVIVLVGRFVPGRFGTPLGVDANRDLAVLSSIGAQIDDLAQRVTEMAERYGDTPDSAISAELFNAERTLLGARRSIDRAAGYLAEH